MTAILMRTPKRNRLTDDERTRRRAERAERKRREAEEERARRTSQLANAKAAVEMLDTSLRAIRDRIKRCEALVHHLKGFYEEIDKLSKRKKPVEATDLAVEQTNEIIRDAKDIVEGDPYMDRVKEFVPAGNNPIYSDILLIARRIRQSLGRFEKRLEEREKRATRLVRESQTIAAALELWSESHRRPSKPEVERLLAAKPVDGWFVENTDGDQDFNFDRLDSIGVDRALTSK